jgi:hypothetical protein
MTRFGPVETITKTNGDLETSSFEFYEQEREITKTLSTLLSNHFYKENNILFAAAMNIVLNQNGWTSGKSSTRSASAASRHLQLLPPNLKKRLVRRQ